MRIHWLASYPKSGNTWIRFLLHQYLFGDVTDTRELSRRIPDLHKNEVASATPGPDGRLFVKVHSIYAPTLPLMNDAERAVYVVRHPRDVLLSCLHYLRLTGGLPPGITDEVYARRFIAEGGDPYMESVGFGPWDQNVRSWLHAAAFPVLAVRYEELKRDTAGVLARVLEFLGDPVDTVKIQRAVTRSTFDRMRALEVEEKSSGRASSVWAGSAKVMRKGLYFMNKGQSGRTLGSIAPDLDRLVEQRFGAVLREAGY